MQTIMVDKGITRGFILGKFMPLHKGHEAMIEYGARNCDILTVLVCSLPNEPIDGKLRYKWVNDRFPNARVLHCDKILPQEPEEHEYFWNIWHNIIKSYHPEPIDHIFGSEQYVNMLSLVMDCNPVIFDKERKIVPVSGTKIRDNPIKYWDYMNEEVRKYFIRRVLIVGAESCGKSTLTEKLATEYNTNFMHEYARTWIDYCIDGNMSKLKYEHFDNFSSAHRLIENNKVMSANKVFFTDTDAITTLVFSMEYYGKVSKKVIELANTEKYDLILLCHPDVRWVDDGQRNLSHKRQEMHDKIEFELTIRDMNWVDIRGNWDERWDIAKKSVDKLLS